MNMNRLANTAAATITIAALISMLPAGNRTHML